MLLARGYMMVHLVVVVVEVLTFVLLMGESSDVVVSGKMLKGLLGFGVIAQMQGNAV